MANVGYAWTEGGVRPLREYMGYMRGINDERGIYRRVRLKGPGLRIADRRVIRDAVMSRPIQRLMLAGAMLNLVGILSNLVREHVFDEMSRLVPAVFGLMAGICIIGGGGYWIVTGRQARALVQAWLRINRCPACLYDLSNTPVTADGGTSCSECGALWAREGSGAKG